MNKKQQFYMFVNTGTLSIVLYLKAHQMIHLKVWERDKQNAAGRTWGCQNEDSETSNNPKTSKQLKGHANNTQLL